MWLALLGIAAVAYPIFSIYYQWRVAKQWCVLCLAVQAILLLQAGAIALGGWLQPAFSGGAIFAQPFPLNLPLNLSLSLNLNLLLPLALTYLLPLLAWLSLKPQLLRWQKAKQDQRAYRRFKFNPEVFGGLLQKQKAILTPTEGLGITLGPADAPNRLIKVCNPYCGPCSKAHPKIEKLLHRHSNLQVQILFMVPDSPGGKLHTTASHLMAIAHSKAHGRQVQQALDDWYLADKKDYEAFAAKYPLNGEVAAHVPALAAMEKWCIANDIRYTPTIFFNGYELPPEYDPEDLPYFLQE
jgi:protein-disulfide isomerase